MDAAVGEPAAEMSEAKRRRTSIEPAVNVPSPVAKSATQPASAPSPKGGVATQQPSMKIERDYGHNDHIDLEVMENKQWKPARGGTFDTLPREDEVKLQAYKPNRQPWYVSNQVTIKLVEKLTITYIFSWNCPINQPT